MGVLCLDGGNDLLNGLHIDQTHQIKAKTVDMVFIRPVVDAVYNVLAHHAAFGCGVVAAERTVGPTTVFTDAAEIGGHDLIEAERLVVIDMVVHHIHDDTHAVVMEALDHLLHFPYANFAVVGIGGKASLGNIVIDGIVAPVVLGLGQTFVCKTIVVNRQ